MRGLQQILVLINDNITYYMQKQGSTKPLNLDYQKYQENNKSLINFLIGEYIVKRQLGTGNFGKVYLAESRRKFQYALKILDLRELQQQQNPRVKAIRERLVVSEPRLMQLCNSPNLIKCYDIFQNKDFKILIMEYCNGGTLSDELKKCRRFKQKTAVDVLRNIINGIAELHKHSIVHRDLKTDNIMKHDGAYKIIDFGFSKKLQIRYETQQVKNTLLGTPTTMAPEVLLRKNYGLKADIWSIGIIFFQMVFGISPYDSNNARSFYQQIQKQFLQEKPVTYAGVTLSAEAHDFLRKVLRVNPDQRIGWREMIEHPLIKIKEEEPITGRFVERFDLEEPEVAPQLRRGSLISVSVEVSPVKELEIPQEREKQASLILSKVDENPKKIEQIKQEKRWQLDQIEEREIQYPRQEPNDVKKPRLFKDDAQLDKSSQQYKKCLGFHLQCLKTQLIFKQIFEPIESYKLIDLNKRQSIQFMHLLISRCFKNMSPLEDQLKNNPQNLHRAFKNLRKQIQNLYTRVSAKFKQYDQRLLQQQNKYMQIAKDWVFKIVRSSNQKEKNIFIGGVERKPDRSFGDFTKQQQIAYTCKIISAIVPNLPILGPRSQSVRKHLQLYNLLATVGLEQLGEQTYADFVQRVLN